MALVEGGMMTELVVPRQISPYVLGVLLAYEPIFLLSISASLIVGTLSVAWIISACGALFIAGTISASYVCLKYKTTHKAFSIVGFVAAGFNSLLLLVTILLNL